MFFNITIYVPWFHVIYVTTTLMPRLSRVGRTTTSTWNHNYVAAIYAYWKQLENRFCCDLREIFDILGQESGE